MIQQTSIDAYHNIRKNGLLSKRRFEVFDQIYQRGPITLNRLIEILYKPGRNTSSISARLSELQRHDVIEADGTVKASTGNTVTLWKATGRLPKKLILKKKTPADDPKELRGAILNAHNRLNCLLLNAIHKGGEESVAAVCFKNARAEFVAALIHWDVREIINS